MTTTPTERHPVITGHGTTKDGRTLYTVSSKSRPGAFHIVTQRAGNLVCDCEAGQYGKLCAHKQVVRARLDARQPVTAVTTEYREPSFRDSAPLLRDNRPFSIFKAE